MTAGALVGATIRFRNGSNQVGVQRYPKLSELADDMQAALTKLRDQIARLADEERAEEDEKEAGSEQGPD